MFSEEGLAFKIFFCTEISSAWSGPYAGNYHRLLYKSINSMTRLKPYSNFVHITQSSGTGKSRMVHEQANLVFTIPFNLRDDAEYNRRRGAKYNGNMSFATVILLSSYQDDVDLLFPPSDALMRLDLVNSTMETVAEAEVHFYIFLGRLFCRVKEELKEIYEGKDKAPTYEALATSWRKHLDAQGVRDRLYRSVDDLFRDTKWVCSFLPCVAACSNCLIRPIGVLSKNTSLSLHIRWLWRHNKS